MKAPTFGPLANSRTIISREISTVPLYPNLQTTSANNDRESDVLSYIKATKLNDIYDLVSESLVYLSILFFCIMYTDSKQLFDCRASEAE